MLMFNFRKNGFVLTEIIVAVAIASVIFLAVFSLGNDIFSFNTNAQKSLKAQSDGRQLLKSLIKELRSASPSSLGAYPISIAGTSTLHFYSDIDSDGYKEQIRYFLQNKDIKKGVIKPSGSPLIYDSDDEKISTVIRDINNGASPIFEYFDSNYAGTSTPLVQPVQITKIRLIRINLMINSDPNKLPTPIIVESQVFLRNLKDNL